MRVDSDPGGPNQLSIAVTVPAELTQELLLARFSAQGYHTDSLTHAGPVPAYVADGLTSPVDHVGNAVSAQGQVDRVVESHAGLGSSSHVVTVIKSPPRHCFRKHRDSPSVNAYTTLLVIVPSGGPSVPKDASLSVAPRHTCPWASQNRPTGGGGRRTATGRSPSIAAGRAIPNLPRVANRSMEVSRSCLRQWVWHPDPASPPGCWYRLLGSRG